ncbi:MAG: nucleotidyltransferase domain-containing protein [Thermodesulfobacteriota bacterium]|jgi:predicted nucleotidyltransferase|nr:nucleotidyltransferase domain-containing protein [Thermodesulfobacteriota bacterium]
MIKEIEKMAHTYAISEIYVFGSRADETARRMRGDEVGADFSTSDVDIGVEPLPGKRLTAKQKVEIALQFEDLLEVSRVDLIVLSEVSPFLALEIVNGRLLYCKDPDAQAEHELLIMRQAGDLAFYERRRREEIMKGAF